MARISVVIPVYNTSQFLRECMDSVVGQTFTDIEIICVNDGSTDDSLSILEGYAEKDDRIMIITQPNGGLSAARNAGMRKSSGEFVFFVDSDDFIRYDACQKMIDNIGNSDIIVSGIHLFGHANLMRDISDRHYFDIPEGTYAIDDNIRLNTYVSAWGKMYRRSIIERCGISFPEGLLFEDYSFHWQYLSVSEKITFVRDELYNYRRRDDSILGNTFERKRKASDHLEIFDHLMTACNKDRTLNDDDTICDVFMQCFTFAYEHTEPEDMLPVLTRSRELVRKYDIHGTRIVDILSSAHDDATVMRMIDASPIRYYLENIDELKGLLRKDGIPVTMKRFIWCVLCKAVR